MALVTPPLSSIRAHSPGEHLELDLLRKLAECLPDSYRLFHSVHWSRAAPQGDQHGELDIVVVNQAGDVAVLEIKAGSVSAGPDGLTKRYQGLQKNVSQQASWQFSGILRRLKTSGLDVRLQHFLVLPHQRVGEQATVAYPRERVADADDCQDLPGFIARRLGAGLRSEMGERVAAFFANCLAVTDDVATLSGRLQTLVTRLSGGLADWVPRIHAPSGVLRVVGTAGSGKTQLALRLLRDAVAEGRAVAYVCFNRPLADHMRQLSPRPAQVATFHQLAWECAGRPSGVPDHDALSSAYAEILALTEPDLDLLVIDELQDFQQPWVEALLQRLRTSARLILLDDPDQRLYTDRAELDLPEAVTVTSHDNHRSPREVVRTLNALRLTRQPIQALSPFIGELPAFLTYKPEGGSLQRVTVQAVQSALAQGYALDDICLITWRGVERSRLLAEDRLSDWALCKFSGRYDDRGQPIWSEGRLRVDTLRRSKGQSAPVVILTEVDFEQLGELERHMLFVGMTRARMNLSVVLTERAAAVLGTQLSDAAGEGV